jgi:hypothetical protein
MSQIAKEDKQHLNRVALIQSLHDEIDDKIKSLSEEVKENPGLRPVLNRYIEHVKTRENEARELQRYFHMLLQSLYQIKTASPTAGASVRPGSASTSGKGSHAMKQLYLDEKAILFELHKWTDVLEGKK